MIILREEKSKSKTGKHATRHIPLIVDLLTKNIAPPRPRWREKTNPTYKKGEAYKIALQLGENQVAVQVKLVKNLRGQVRGQIEVYSPQGTLLYRAVYRKLKLRYSCGDPKYSWIAEIVADHLKIPVKNTNLKPQKTTPCR